MTGDREVVAVVLDVGGTGVDHQIGLSHMGQCPGGVMRHPADTMASVGIVIADTVIAPHAATELLTLLNTAHIVIDTVHSLEKNPKFWLVLTHSI